MAHASLAIVVGRLAAVCVVATAVGLGPDALAQAPFRPDPAAGTRLYEQGAKYMQDEGGVKTSRSSQRGSSRLCSASSKRIATWAITSASCCTRRGLTVRSGTRGQLDFGRTESHTRVAVRIQRRAARFSEEPPMHAHPRRGLTLLELVIALVAIAALSFIVVQGRQERSNRSGCKNNQKQLMLAEIMYRDSVGRSAAWVGARNLVASGIVTETDTFICPSTDDVFDPARGLASSSYVFSTQAPLPSTPSLTTALGASNRVLMADDDVGPVRFNHGDVCIVAFADGHVEEVPVSDPRLAGIAGGPGLLAGLGK